MELSSDHRHMYFLNNNIHISKSPIWGRAWCVCRVPSHFAHALAQSCSANVCPVTEVVSWCLGRPEPFLSWLESNRELRGWEGTVTPKPCGWGESLDMSVVGWQRQPHTATLISLSWVLLDFQGSWLRPVYESELEILLKICIYKDMYFLSWAPWHTSLIPGLKRQKAGDHYEFKVNLVYRASFRLARATKSMWRQINKRYGFENIIIIMSVCTSVWVYACA